MFFPCSPRRHAGSPLAPWLTLMLLLGASASLADPAPIVVSIDPDAAAPGDLVTLSGENLHEPGKDSYAWVRTSRGGFVLEAPAATEGTTSLTTTVGPVASLKTGTVELWRGRAHEVPPRTLWVNGRLVTALGSRVFVAHDVSLDGPSFSPLATSDDTIEAPPAEMFLSIDLDRWGPIDPDKEPRMRVDAVIETGGGTDGGGNGPLIHTPLKARVTGNSPSWTLHMIVESDRAFEGWSAAEISAALAALLTEQFGSLGLNATADGPRLVLTSEGGILGGFMTISPY